MRRTIEILIMTGILLSSPVFGETVLVGLDDDIYSNFSDWRSEMISNSQTIRLNSR